MAKLNVKDPKRVVDNVEANDLIKRLDELFVGHDPNVVVNVLGSYAVQSMILINDRNRLATKTMLIQYHKGLAGLCDKILDDMKKGAN